jgi:hypothetical protein
MTGEVAQVKKVMRARVGRLSRRCSRNNKCVSISTSTA